MPAPSTTQPAPPATRRACTHCTTRVANPGRPLCRYCHNNTVTDHESPLELTDGTWVKGEHGIYSWVAA